MTKTHIKTVKDPDSIPSECHQIFKEQVTYYVYKLLQNHRKRERASQIVLWDYCDLVPKPG